MSAYRPSLSKKHQNIHTFTLAEKRQSVPACLQQRDPLMCLYLNYENLRHRAAIAEPALRVRNRGDWRL